MFPFSLKAELTRFPFSTELVDEVRKPLLRHRFESHAELYLPLVDGLRHEVEACDLLQASQPFRLDEGRGRS